MRSLLLLGLLAAAAGCSERQWEVAAENQGDVPCSVAVELAGSSRAETPKLNKKRIIMIGGRGDTVVNSVKVVRDGKETTLTPTSPLPAGSRFLIVVTADGAVNTSTTP